MKVIKYEHVPVPKGTVRSIVVTPEGVRFVVQSTTRAEYKLLSAAVLYDYPSHTKKDNSI